jgi:HAD superfamily hydrolase (TIGR01509 family)
MEYIFNYDLFIFDLDDTLIKTELMHYEAWFKVLKEEINNFEMDFTLYCQKFHSIENDFIKKYFEEELKLTNYIDLTNKKIYYYNELIKQNDIKFIDGADNFINKIIENNKKFVIVTNSSKYSVDIIINKLPLLKKANKIYYKEMFVNKKPNPECYIKVINDFCNYKKIIGFEDSLTGIQAITQVKEIKPIFINSTNYYHYNYIINKYKTEFINNYIFYT